MQLVHRSAKVLAEARGRVEERFGFGGDPVVLGDRVHHGTQRSTEAFAANHADRAPGQDRRSAPRCCRPPIEAVAQLVSGQIVSPLSGVNRLRKWAFRPRSREQTK